MAKRSLVTPEALSADTQSFFATINNDSDVSLVVLSTGYVDACLGSLLQSFMIESSVVEEVLDSRSGALGSFSSRSHIAYILGLIPKSIYQDLLLLAQIRNEFAHHHLSLSFSVPAVSATCAKLAHLALMKNDDNGNPFSVEKMPAARERFRITVVVIAIYLLNAAKSGKRCVPAA